MRFVKPQRNVVRSVGVFALSTLAVVLATALEWTATAAPPAQGGFGTIRGRLVWAGDELPSLDLRSVDRQQDVCGNIPVALKYLVVDPKTKGIGNAFAYLLGPTRKNPDALQALLAQAAEVVIDQRKCEFIPFSTALHQDQILVFKSSDPINHNVRYTALRNNALNQILPPNSELEVKLIAEKAPLRLGCNLHTWMKGTVMVFDHPFFAVTKDDGSFEIEGVPAGEQKLVLRLADGKYVVPRGDHAMEVKVDPGKTSDVEIKMDTDSRAARSPLR
jgi:hypothetical protein